MAATEEFRLPNTPPSGYTFPPVSDIQNVPSPKEMEAADKHNRKPSLTINTRELSSIRPQQQLPPPPLPPPPPRAPGHSAGKRRSNSQPARPLLVTAASLPSPPARKRESIAARPVSTTPTHRSVFPQYNPAVSSEVSGTRSNGASPPATQADFPSSYRHSIYSTARSPPMNQGSLSQAFAAPAEPSGCQLPSYRESMYGVPVVVHSTPNDVIDLWCLANGQDDQELALSYNLGLDCTDLELNNELICLTSTAGAVYTLRASNNALNITRTNPLNGANTMSIAAPTLYTPSDSSQLLTTIFPVLAKIRAIDQAASTAISHALGRSQGAALERENITRAHATTAAPVLFNKTTQRFYVSLPHYSPDADSIDVAPAHHTLPVEVTPNVSIRILEPPSAQSAANPILTLSLHAKVLIVHSHALASLPTPYGVDILVSAMMVLVLHLHRQDSLLSYDNNATSSTTELIPTFAPPPTIAGSTSRAGGSSSRSNTKRDRSTSRAGSRLGSLLHPNRRPAELPTERERSRSHLGIYPQSQTRALSRLSTHSAAATTLHGSPPLHAPSTPGLEKGLDQQLSDRGTAPELNPRVTGLDLSRFQAYDLADPRLGYATKGVLRALYWTLGVLVWVMGVSVGVLAELVVVIGTCRGRKGGG